MKTFLIVVLLVAAFAVAILVGFFICVAGQLTVDPDVNEAILRQYERNRDRATWRYGITKEFAAEYAYNMQLDAMEQELLAREIKLENRIKKQAEITGKDVEELELILERGGWICSGCDKIHKGYEFVCSCGMTQEQNEEYDV